MLGTPPVPGVNQATPQGAAGHEQQPQAPAPNFSKSYPFPTGTYRSLPYRYLHTGYSISTAGVKLRQCCGAGAESRGAEIKLPPGAGAEITNWGPGSGFGSFLFTTDLKKFYRKTKKIMVT